MEVIQQKMFFLLELQITPLSQLMETPVTTATRGARIFKEHKC